MFFKNIKLILTSQQRFRTGKHNIFTEESKKIVLNVNNYKRIKSVKSIETHAYGTRKDVASKTEEIKCNNKVKQNKKDLL